jgi:hypothetical protein
MSLPSPAPDDTVLITGASAGIGTELARQLAARGHNVTLVARREDRLAELAEKLRLANGIVADMHPCDLGDDAARAAVVKALQTGEKQVAAVCNNAGYGSFGKFYELDLEREVAMVRLNVLALHELTGTFLPDMVRRGSGAILNVASVAAFQPLPLNATYAATKAFVHSFSEAVHSEISGTGVSVTSLCPGFTKTEFEQAAGAEDAAAKLPGFTWMESEDVARQAVEGMLAGKRTIVPGAINKAVSTSGRFIPRTVLLPLVKTVAKNG